MKNLKKSVKAFCLALTVSTVMCLPLTPIPAYAAETTTNSDTNVSSVSFPEGFSMEIENDSYKSTSGAQNIVNNNNNSASVSFLGAAADAQSYQSAPKIVAYKDADYWKSLSENETNSAINLGVNLNGEDVWSNAQTTATSDFSKALPIKTVNLPKTSAIPVALISQHGNKWVNTQDEVFPYTVYFLVQAS